MDIKEIKKSARKNLKREYLKSVLLMFIFTIVIGGGYTFTSVMLDSPTLEKVFSYNNIKENTIEVVKEKTNADILSETADAFNEINNIEEHVDKEKQSEFRGLLAPIVNHFTRSRSVIIYFLMLLE